MSEETKYPRQLCTPTEATNCCLVHRHAPALLEKLTALAGSAETYMKYHAEKFYPNVKLQPTGLWPAIEKARTAIKAATEGE